MMLSANAPGWASSAGANATVRATAVAAAAPAKRAALRGPSRVTIMAARTGRAGHAMAFIAHAVPIARAASPFQVIQRDDTSPGHGLVRAGASAADRLAQARARHIRAISGGSVSPSAMGNASTGVTTASAVYRSTVLPPGRGRPMAIAAVTSTSETAAIHDAGLPRTPGRPARLGNPKTDMAGR